MAIGRRIKFFRNKCGMKQKELGEKLGFLGKTSEVRIAQYENEARTPKPDLIRKMAKIFHVSPKALTVPEIDTYVGLLHTFFALEDMYGIKIDVLDQEMCLRLDKSTGSLYCDLFDVFYSWFQKSKEFESGKITKEEYDEWRYNYPDLDYWTKLEAELNS